MTWLGRLLHRKRLEQQMQSELRDHLERQVADNICSGMAEPKRVGAPLFVLEATNKQANPAAISEARNG
jgi:hypothetical protein